MKHNKLKNKKGFSKCDPVDVLPKLECSDFKIENRITKVTMDLKGNCFDKFGNYLGKGILQNGVLKIIRQ